VAYAFPSAYLHGLPAALKDDDDDDYFKTDHVYSGYAQSPKHSSTCLDINPLFVERFSRNIYFLPET